MQTRRGQGWPMISEIRYRKTERIVQKNVWLKHSSFCTIRLWQLFIAICDRCNCPHDFMCFWTSVVCRGLYHRTRRRFWNCCGRTQIPQHILTQVKECCPACFCHSIMPGDFILERRALLATRWVLSREVTVIHFSIDCALEKPTWLIWQVSSKEK